MLEQRYDAHATIVPDEYEGTIGGRIRLLRLVITNDGPLTDPDTGHQYTQKTCFCYLNAFQARQFADRLHALADQLTATTAPAKTTA